MKKTLSAFIFAGALLTAVPVQAFAFQTGVVLVLSLDKKCVKTTAQQRDDATDKAYKEYRAVTEKARTVRKEALAEAKKDKTKKKVVEAAYRAALTKANKDLSTEKKNISSKFKAQVSLCKK